MRESARILIAEEIPSYNKGEQAIFRGMLASFKALGNVEVKILSFLPETDIPRYSSTNIHVIDGIQGFALPKFTGSELQSKHIIFQFFFSMLVAVKLLTFGTLYKILGGKVNKIYKGSFWKELHDCDIIIIGHDSVGVAYAPYFPFYPLYVVIFGKLMEKPVVFYGNTHTYRHRRVWQTFSPIINQIMRRVDLITTREKDTYNFLKKMLGDKAPVYLAADLAFIADRAPIEKIRHIISIEGLPTEKSPLIGVTVTNEVCASAFPHITSSKKKCTKCARTIAEVFDNLVESINAFIVFLPHSIEPWSDDRLMSTEIVNSMRNRQNVLVVTNEYSSMELLSLTSIFDMFIGMRLHSVIDAFLNKVPFLFITRSLDDRAYGVIKLMGMDKWTYNVERLESGTLIDKIQQLWRQKREVSSEITVMNKILRRRALSNGKLLKALLRQARVW